MANQFDQTPNYNGSGLRFAFSDKRVTAFDDMGDTAMEVILNVLKICKNETLISLWHEITEEGTVYDLL